MLNGLNRIVFMLEPSHSPPVVPTTLNPLTYHPTVLAIMSDEITGSICKAVWLQCLGMKADEHDLGAGERGEGRGLGLFPGRLLHP